MASKVRRITEDYKLFVDALTEKELLIDSNPLAQYQVEGCDRISWSRAGNLAYLFTDYSSIEQYVQVLNNRDFNFCFIDGGLAQIDYTIKGDEVIKHRLCYIPCPFSYNPADWPDIPLSDIPSMMGPEDFLRNAKLASPIRFDFDSKFQDERHAYSHVTLNKQTCRIPAYGPVSLGHFFRFVIRYFYEETVEMGEWLADVRPRLYSRTLEHPSPHEIHIDSAVGFE
ncbi:hypothetical protein BLA9940_07002 [Burkholderia aenigmatica]|uniref:DUF2290 domain-containing protein n=1 Tax=Burkholderia cepacia complex TaxID=87882 RepID=UPI000F08736A|nr:MULTISPECIES: DUF2290 domain-containing protein [Burkholderia cepacia complex]AYQ36685.1 hypothetical protein CVS37_00105 [Burkholderia lata]VWD13602.1 hypothetical protein BLA9940_07002 [Burkholderia aenigmatica]